MLMRVAVSQAANHPELLKVEKHLDQETTQKQLTKVQIAFNGILAERASSLCEDKNLSALVQSNYCSKLRVFRNLLLDFKH
jgi:hypothetical protein